MGAACVQGMDENSLQYPMRFPGGLPQPALTFTPTDRVDAQLLILDVAYTSDYLAHPYAHRCSATSCICSSVLIGCPAWHFPTRSSFRCPSSPAPVTSWRAASTV